MMAPNKMEERTDKADWLAFPLLRWLLSGAILLPRLSEGVTMACSTEMSVVFCDTFARGTTFHTRVTTGSLLCVNLNSSRVNVT
jgi:hypothetical protein